eukprot:1538334-Amphidinium_carterae.2
MCAAVAAALIRFEAEVSCQWSVSSKAPLKNTRHSEVYEHVLCFGALAVSPGSKAIPNCRYGGGCFQIYVSRELCLTGALWESFTSGHYDSRGAGWLPVSREYQSVTVQSLR